MKMNRGIKLDLGSLRELYKSGVASPADVIATIYDRMNEQPLEPVWISVVPREKALLRARQLERDPVGPVRPLYGVPFAIKDNIDLAGLPTTAACPAYGYAPARSATGSAGAGGRRRDSDRQDQYGSVRHRPGGHALAARRLLQRLRRALYLGRSSSGSAVAVASGLASFALGTDTAGSGRVPAAFNGLVGLKPTRGVLSTQGVVPACRTLDCVSIFVADLRRRAHRLERGARASIADDSFSRLPGAGDEAAPVAGRRIPLRRAVRDQLEFFGDDAAAALYAQAVERMEALGGRKVEIDFAIFRAAADLLYAGPWVAERYAAIRHVYRGARGRDEPGGARHHRRRAPLLGGRRLRGRIQAARSAPRRGSPVGEHGRPAAADDRHHLHARSGRHRLRCN